MCICSCDKVFYWCTGFWSLVCVGCAMQCWPAAARSLSLSRTALSHTQGHLWGRGPSDSPLLFALRLCLWRGAGGRGRGNLRCNARSGSGSALPSAPSAPPAAQLAAPQPASSGPPLSGEWSVISPLTLSVVSGGWTRSGRCTLALTFTPRPTPESPRCM